MKWLLKQNNNRSVESKDESTLDEKHSSIAYPFTRYCLVLGWIDGKNNIADAFTQRLPETVRDFLFGNWTY